MRTAARVFVLSVLVALLAGCAAREVLEPKSAVVPADVDLSGLWTLRAGGSGSITGGGTESGASDMLADVLGRTRPRRRPPPPESLVGVFLESGTNLKITQNPFALFISFDRSVVEEYRFGENRRVNVGPVRADRVSGWEEDSYVIETLDEAGGKLVERYTLMPGGDALLRQVSVYEDGTLASSYVQRFVRRDARQGDSVGDSLPGKDPDGGLADGPAGKRTDR